WTDTGVGLSRTDTILEAAETKALAVRLLGQGGKRLDEGMPFGDVQLPIAFWKLLQPKRSRSDCWAKVGNVLTRACPLVMCRLVMPGFMRYCHPLLQQVRSFLSVYRHKASPR